MGKYLKKMKAFLLLLALTHSLNCYRLENSLKESQNTLNYKYGGETPSAEECKEMMDNINKAEKNITTDEQRKQWQAAKDVITEICQSITLPSLKDQINDDN